MASIIPGFEYDIFISYRQKDNRHDSWVTEFVNNLKGELESTFKYEINVYFDINTHDGLLENHDVEASLKDKLKCLIFIPVISRTYCDPKSFAWEHEFKAFVEMASMDPLGLRIKLRRGNVASRVLPVIIHDLDPEDVNQCESIIGGHLRGIEFIYKEPGVNKPLTAEDDEKKNLNKTKYRIQINKVANAISEIMVSLTSHDEKVEHARETVKAVVHKGDVKRTIFSGVILVLILAISWFVISHKIKGSELKSANTIAVLPFINMSKDPAQEYFSDGIGEEILNHLFQIGDLEITNSNSSRLFKDSKLTIKEISRRLNVKYLIEGKVERAGDRVRIFIQLINGEDGNMRWSRKYDRIITDNNWLDVHSDVAEQVAHELKIHLDSSIKARFVYKPTENPEAYDLYLQAKSTDSLYEAQVMLQKAISLDPDFAEAYVRLAFVYIWEGGHSGPLSREEVLENAEPLIEKALQLDRYSVGGHLALAHLKLYYYWDFKAVNKEYDLVKKLSPSNSNDLPWFTDFLLSQGKFQEAFFLQQEIFEHNRNNPHQLIQLALTASYIRDTIKTIEYLKEVNDSVPKNNFVLLNTIRIYNYMGKYAEALKFYNDKFKEWNNDFKIPYYQGHIGIAYYKTGNKEKSDQCLKTLIELSEKTTVGSPSFFTAALYTAMNKKDEALKMLEKARRGKEVEMYWLKVEPLFLSLREEPEFKEILSKIGFK